MQVREGLAAIAAPCADRLMASAAHARLQANADTLHDLRVCVRQMRAALSIFRGVIPDRERESLRSALRWLIRKTSPTRDLDVFVEGTLREATRHGANSGVEAVLEIAVAAQDRARRLTLAALARRKYLQLLAGLEWLSSQCRSRGRDEKPREGARHWRRTNDPLFDLATTVLRKRHKKLRKLIAVVDTLDREDLHCLRIRIRAQRYTTELLAPLYPDRAVRRYVSKLKTLQRKLGAIHDLQVAQDLLLDLTPVSAARRARVRLERQCTARLSKRRSGLKRYCLGHPAPKPFWT